MRVFYKTSNFVRNGQHEQMCCGKCVHNQCPNKRETRAPDLTQSQNISTFFRFRLVVWSIILIDLTKGLLTGGEWGEVVGDKIYSFPVFCVCG